MSCNLLIDWSNFQFFFGFVFFFPLPCNTLYLCVCVCVLEQMVGGRELLPATLWGSSWIIFSLTRHPPPTLCWFIIFPPFRKKTKSSLKVTNLWWWLIQFIEGVDHPTTRRSSKNTSLRPPPDWRKQFSWHFDVHVSMLDGPRCLYQSSSNLTLWNTCCFETPFHFVFLFRIPTITFSSFPYLLKARWWFPFSF